MTQAETLAPPERNAEHNPYLAPRAEIAAHDDFAESGALIMRMPAARFRFWLAEGWRLFVSDMWQWVAAMFVFMLISTVIGVVPIIKYFAFVPTMILTGGLYMGCRDAVSGRHFRLTALFAGFDRHVGALLLVGLAPLVVTLVCLPLLGGLVVGIIGVDSPFWQTFHIGSLNAALVAMLAIFFVVLSLLFLAIGFCVWFAPILIVRDNRDALSAIRLSFSGCLRNFWPLAWYGLVFGLLSIVAALPVMLGFFVLMPVILCANYVAACEIFALEPA